MSGNGVLVLSGDVAAALTWGGTAKGKGVRVNYLIG